MRRPGEHPDRLARSILAYHGCWPAGDDGSGQYQRYARSNHDGIVFFSGLPCPWHYYCLDGFRGLLVAHCDTLFAALARLRCAAVIKDPT